MSSGRSRTVASVAAGPTPNLKTRPWAAAEFRPSPAHVDASFRHGTVLGACLRIDQLTLLIGQDSPVATNPAWCGWTYPGRLSKTPLPMAWHDSLLFPVAPLPLTLPEIPAPKRNSFSRLWPAQMSSHSRFTFARPRSRNCRKPRPCLIWPNTGSTVSIRRAQRSRPRFVRSLRRIRSLTDSPLGMRPRCAGSNTLPWRVFSGAMNGFAPSA